MLLNLALTIGLFIALAGLLEKWRQNHLATIPRWTIPTLFLVKCCAGLFYAYVLYEGIKGDTWEYFRGGGYVTAALQEGFQGYLRLVFGANGGYLDPSIFPYAYDSNFWGITGSYNMVRFHALLHPFSNGFYPFHLIVFNFFTLIGSLLLFKTLSKGLKVKAWHLFVCVLVPSALLFHSGIHKDGFSWVGICLILYGLFADLSRVKRILLCLVGLVLLWLIRPYLIVLLVVPILGYLVVGALKLKPYFSYGLSLLLGVISGFALDRIFSGKILTVLIDKRNEFETLHQGNTSFQIPELKSWSDLIADVPRTFIDSFFRPFISEVGISIQLLFSIEAILIVALVGYIVVKIPQKLNTCLGWFILILSIELLLFYGVIISNEGSLLRYRSLAWGLLGMFGLFTIFNQRSTTELSG